MGSALAMVHTGNQPMNRIVKPRAVSELKHYEDPASTSNKGSLLTVKRQRGSSMSQKYSQAAVAYIQKKPSNNNVNKNNSFRGTRKRFSLGGVPASTAGDFYST